MKRADLIDFLKEVLRVCGESIIMEMIWLKKNSPKDNSEEQGEDYHLVVHTSSNLSDIECLNEVNERFGTKMGKHGNFWVFSEK